MAVIVKISYFLLLFSFLEAAGSRPKQNGKSVKPELDNIVAEIGQEVTFNYKATEKSKWPDWYFTRDGNTSFQIIAPDCKVTDNFKNKYKIDGKGQNLLCNLIILHATFEEAGVYTCVDHAVSANVSALLNIIDPSAIVVVHNQTEEIVENDSLNISCSLTYSGAIVSALTITVSLNWITDDPGQNFTIATTKSFTPTGIVITSVAVTRPIVPIFICEAKFGLSLSHPSEPFHDKLIENNNYLWPTENIYYVSYPPDSAYITSGKCHKMSLKSMLKCNADSHPSSNYQWMDHCGTPISTESTIEMQHPDIYNCTAYNTIRGKNFSVSNNVEFSGCPTVYMPKCKGPGCEITLIILSTCFGITVLVGVAFLIIKYREQLSVWIRPRFQNIYINEGIEGDEHDSFDLPQVGRRSPNYGGTNENNVLPNNDDGNNTECQLN